MNNIIEKPEELEGLKERDKLSHEMFIHIADGLNLSDTTILHLAEIVHSYKGRDSIEENLKEKLKEHGIEGE